jgi:FtsZ-binding cell division protein ZapB
MGEPLEEDLVSEISRLLSELDTEDTENVLEEELIVDTSMQKSGNFMTLEASLQYERDLELARRKSTEYKEENEALEKKIKELKENHKRLQNKNKQYKDVLEKVNQKLNETLLSNAKLLYSNRTLSDASLNERQKSKIVEAIAKANTPEEARTLCEALSTTVTSGNDKKHPRTLSESVQRRSNLSGILPRRNKQAIDEKHTFADHMKKLAGIK